MFGEGTGSLALFTKERNGHRTGERWGKSGNQGIFWKQAKVSVNQHGLYQVSAFVPCLMSHLDRRALCRMFCGMLTIHFC